MKKEKKVLEKDIQKEILEWLNEQGYLFWRCNNVPVFSRNNGGHMAFRALPRFTPKGLPDIMVIVEGIFWAIECKAPNVKTLRPDQLNFATYLEINKGKYIMANSLDDVKFLLPTVSVYNHHFYEKTKKL